jgi:hypothetical protein
MVTELFHPDGRTGMTKLAVAFRNFANAPKNLAVNTRDLHYGNKTINFV